MADRAPAPARAAVLVWTVGLSAYFLAVVHRTSLAVAGLAATERFDLSASQLASFTMLQLLVYAGMQVPVGLLVDRFGPRSVLLTGVAVMSVAQVGFALAESYPVALAARILVGVGDAMTFICVLRLVSAWFPVRRIPLVSQLTGVLGQTGAVATAAPMTLALRELGWTGAYLVLAAAGPVLLVVMLAVLRDAPGTRTVRGTTLSPAAVRRSLAASWAQPGTHLGLWMHVTTQSSATALGLLWGYPWLVRSEGVAPTTAAALLSLMVIASASAGPVLGWFVAAHPRERSTLVIAVVLAVVAVWTVVLAWQGPAPLPLLVLLFVVVGVGGPTSMVGFDVGRTSNPPERFASATGIINQGGFTGSLVLIAAIGVVLDLGTPPGADYGPDAFLAAMLTQYAVWSLGLVQLLRWRRRARAHAVALAPPGPVVS